MRRSLTTLAMFAAMASACLAQTIDQRPLQYALEDYLFRAHAAGQALAVLRSNTVVTTLGFTNAHPRLSFISGSTLWLGTNVSAGTSFTATNEGAYIDWNMVSGTISVTGLTGSAGTFTGIVNGAYITGSGLAASPVNVTGLQDRAEAGLIFQPTGTYATAAQAWTGVNQRAYLSGPGTAALPMAVTGLVDAVGYNTFTSSLHRVAFTGTPTNVAFGVIVETNDVMAAIISARGTNAVVSLASSEYGTAEGASFSASGGGYADPGVAQADYAAGQGEFRISRNSVVKFAVGQDGNMNGLGNTISNATFRGNNFYGGAAGTTNALTPNGLVDIGGLLGGGGGSSQRTVIWEVTNSMAASHWFAIPSGYQTIRISYRTATQYSVAGEATAIFHTKHTQWGHYTTTYAYAYLDNSVASMQRNYGIVTNGGIYFPNAIPGTGRGANLFGGGEVWISNYESTNGSWHAHAIYGANITMANANGGEMNQGFAQPWHVSGLPGWAITDLLFTASTGLSNCTATAWVER